MNIIQIKNDPDTNEPKIENEIIKTKIPSRCRHTTFIFNNFLYIFGGEGFEDFLEKKGKKNNNKIINIYKFNRN